MKPTVSVSSKPLPVDRSTRRVVGSRVANKRCSACTCAPVSALRSVDLPAFVYPTIAAVSSSARRRPVRCWWRCERTCSISRSRSRMRLRMRLLGEDLENDFCAVEHADLELELQVALLTRTQVVVADDKIECTLELELAELIQLAHADEMCGIDS